MSCHRVTHINREIPLHNMRNNFEKRIPVRESFQKLYISMLFWWWCKKKCKKCGWLTTKQHVNVLSFWVTCVFFMRHGYKCSACGKKGPGALPLVPCHQCLAISALPYANHDAIVAAKPAEANHRSTRSYSRRRALAFHLRCTTILHLCAHNFRRLENAKGQQRRD